MSTPKRILDSHLIKLGWKSCFVSSLRRTRDKRVAGGTISKFACGLFLVCLSTLGWAQEKTNDTRFSFDIPQQRADHALTEFAEQADLTLMVPHELVREETANALIGEYTLQEGVDILLAGTGLSPTFSNPVVLSITTDTESANGGENVEIIKKAGFLATVAAVFTGANAQEPESSNDEDVPEAIEEIVVTGSSIRGVQNTASPLFRFDKSEIEASGYATVQQFIQTIPQNFGGGANENTAGTNAGLEANETGGTAINLRGLGRSSTLTLVNGRRVAPAGTNSFTDISSIPTSAIDRIEILTDGASAIYGADAVAGVVNVILRDEYDGAETILRYGAVTDGGLAEYRLAQTFGGNWDGGNALVTYEYFERSELDAIEREYSADAATNGPQTLLPEISRHSVFATGHQEIGDNVSLVVQGYFNTRNLKASDSQFSVVTKNGDFSEYGVSAGVDLDIRNNWQLSLHGTSAVNEFENETFVQDTASTNSGKFDQSIWTVDMIADGPLFELPGGKATAAIGGQFRTEELSRQNIGPDLSRDVSAVFGEVHVPIVGENNRMSGVERLEITAAIRYEDYDDVGSTTDPKFGLLWSPVPGLDFRGTWGTSFRAPRLREVDPNEIAGSTLIQSPAIVDPIFGMSVPMLFFSTGANENLGPESATTWTIGMDIQPQSVPRLNMKFTYFDVDFDDRIKFPFDRASPLAGLDPKFVDSPNVIRNPSLDVTQSFLDESDPGFVFDFFGGPLSDILTIVDFRPVNVARVQVSGLDFLVEYSVDTGSGEFGLGLNGSYLTDWDQQITSFLPVDSLLDTVFNPSELKLRARADWNYRGASAALFLNYVSGSKNTIVTPALSTSSWTTVDINLQYDTGDQENTGLFDNLTIAVSVVNLFDEDPPFVRNQGSEVNFDGTNANALGRFVSFQVSKAW